MHYYVFKQPHTSIDVGLDWLDQMRHDFGTQIEIIEFQWAEHDFYITFLASSDVAKQIFIKYPTTEKFDRWDVGDR